MLLFRKMLDFKIFYSTLSVPPSVYTDRPYFDPETPKTIVLRKISFIPYTVRQKDLPHELSIKGSELE